MSHPLGVRPRGNAFTGLSSPDTTRASLGRYFGALTDALLASSLLPRCDAASLNALAQTSRALYAFARDDELWRALVLRDHPRDFHFTRSWRRTHARARARARNDGGGSAGRAPVRVVQATGVYSDVLFHKWRCQSAAMLPSWLDVENVTRVDAADLSTAAFRDRFERPGVPVVITGVVDKWDASKEGKWTRADFATRFGDVEFVAGGFDLNMQRYLDYGDAAVGKCDQPLYLFDKDFGSKAPALTAEYTVPEYFRDDLFQHLGEATRPAYRWLIVGPANSGSTFHKDPNGTSAWNACVRGSKRWVLFPPDVPPPGVHPSADECDVVAPVSVLEWYISYYDAARATGAGVECTVGAGEVVFVPAGWWHAVVNLEWSAAVTQNFVSAAGFPRVCAWLRDRADQVSGCRDAEHAALVSREFRTRVLAARPELDAGEPGTARKRQKTCGLDGGLWDGLRDSKTFSFGIG
jgi:Cupin-like domain